MAPEGYGKTDMSLTGPMPMLDLTIDPNTEDVVQKVYGKPSEDLDPDELRVVHIPMPLIGFEANEDDIRNEALDSWEQLTKEVSDVLHDRATVRPRTVILDTGTELSELNVLAEFGRTDKISPNMRRAMMGNVNNQFKGIFRALAKAGVHVVVTHRVREKWETVQVRTKKGIEEKDQRVPGEYLRVGFREMGNICNVEVLMLFDQDREGKLSNKFGMRVLRSTIRPALIGQEFWGKVECQGQMVRAASIPYLGTLLYPDTKLSEWE